MTISDINSLARFLSDTDTTSLTAANLLILVNASYERIVGKIHAETMGGRWKFGDVNYTAFPTYTMNLVNSQAEYQIDSLTGVLTILGVEILDNNSLWHKISPITLEDIHNQGIAQVEHYKTDGRPVEYEKRENMIVLYPAPDNGVSVTLTAGLKIFFLRTADTYTSAQVTTGTKEPGFPSPWHDILAYESALAYCQNYKKDRVPYLAATLAKKEKELFDFIARRNQDDRPAMTMRSINFR